MGLILSSSDPLLNANCPTVKPPNRPPPSRSRRISCRASATTTLCRCGLVHKLPNRPTTYIQPPNRPTTQLYYIQVYYVNANPAMGPVCLIQVGH